MLRLATIAVIATLPAFAGAQEAPASSEFSGSFIGVGGTPAGQAEFTDTPNGVLIEATFEPGALPAGEHALHFHETADCSDTEAFETAGAHHNPTSAEHGFLPEAGPHAGDLPNVVIAAGETTAVSMFTPMVRFTEGEAPLFDDDGSALVIHAGADDYESQPSGDSGDRIACIELTGE